MRIPGFTAFLTLLLAAPAMAQAERLIRIGILEQAPAATLSCSVPSVLMEGDRLLATLPASFSLAVALEGTTLKAMAPDGTLLQSAGPWRLRPESPAPEARTFLGARRYRGEMEARVGKDYLTVVNELQMEQYLYGVVPCEVIPSWKLDALKCEAVAARTYAVRNLGQFASLGYDLKATDASQVYRGASAEVASTNLAVDSTRSEILTYQGRPIWAAYADSAGGYTESSLEVWGYDYPYLQAVPDFDQESPRYVWEFNASGDKLAKAIPKLGVAIGDLNDIEVLERSYSGRVKKARLMGTQGTAEVTGDKIRFSFGLRSTFFNVAKQPDGSFLFVGRGWGHGVGMSQWGAKRLADMGYTYQQILAHYYPGTQLSPDRAVALPARPSRSTRSSL